MTMNAITPRIRHDTLDSSTAVVSVVVLGDGIVILGFFAVGLLSHAIEPWTYPLHTLRTAVPFLAGWLIVSPLVGTLRLDTLSSPFETLWYVTLGWIGASVVGAAIRSTVYFPGGAPLEFVLVNVVFGLAFVLPWRLCVSLLVRRARRRLI
ncbi:DUF3054 domain-containing protein [Natronosalvus halobius]|uniref:DUF3054 domain-containing protein n=1 Tax=Natronosalvus halobius TaxID=2953746 RepID=UPI00209DEB21|nr:DUF3054 domain-containing protein [Natronosalvus halobius]USZ72206.1 DUF3054 domain-containing protein [Natronosalvus halobius]